MKINEILTEGPLDFAKKVGAFATGGRAGWQTQSAANMTADRTNKIVLGALQKWSELAQNITASGQTATPAEATAWFTKFTGVAPSVNPAATDPATMKKWLTTEVNRFLANRAQATAPVTPEAPVTQSIATPMSTPAGVEIISPDPLVLRYRNVDYVQNNQGQWAKFNSTTPLAATEQAFFNKQMDILHPATPE
jgi:hypothetical protein